MFKFILSSCFLNSAFLMFAQDSVIATINNLPKPLISNFSDYAPVISADGSTMMFTSRRSVTKKELKKKLPSLENVYVSNLTESKNWSIPQKLPGNINVIDRYNSAISLSNDGQTLLLYRDNNNGIGDIYYSKLKGTEWSKSKPFPRPINSEFQETSASLSPNGKIIYFVSERKGGIGGKDIWVSNLEKNENWSEPKNLGLNINSDLDEEGIYLHPDGVTMYFSSKGHDGLGGYDVFKSTLINNEWTMAENLNAPINTANDDVYFVMTANGRKAYYTSAKEGGNGEKDIYEIAFKTISKKTKEVASQIVDKSPKLTLFSGIVQDKLSGLPLECKVQIVDNVKNDVISEVNSNSSSGKFLISLPSGKNYGIVVKKEGYLFHSENITLPDSSTFNEVVVKVFLEKLDIGSKIVLKNIFYDFNKANLRDESINELTQLLQLLNDNKTLKIELSSHTDDKGSDEYNLKLSQSRAQSVVNYLVEKGIDKERLEAKGLGETSPISDNITDEGRQRNRRTEFKILSK